MGLSN